MHNAKLGRSPYINVDNNGKVKNVNTKINNKEVLVAYFDDNFNCILYNTITIAILLIIFTILNTSITSK